MNKTLPRSIPLLMSKQIRPKPQDKIQTQFLKFHTNNPGIYTDLVELARKAKKSGRSTYGIEVFFSLLRWEYEIANTGESFKLNNSFTSRYARLIMEQEPDLKGFFTTRNLVSTCRTPKPQVARS